MQDFQVAGITFRGEAVHGLRPKGDVTFVREPDNKVDKYAIKIMWEDNNIGYVPAAGSLQSAIGARLDAGKPIKAYVLKYAYRGIIDGKKQFNDDHIGVLNAITISVDIKQKEEPKSMQKCDEEVGVDMISFNEGIKVNFKEIAHTYDSGGVRFTGITTYIKKYVEDFDKERMIPVCSKAWGIGEDTIDSAWGLSGDLAAQFGTAIHKALEFELLYGHLTKKKDGTRAFSIKHPIINSVVKDFFTAYDALGFEGAVLPEALLTNKAKKTCALVDSLLVIDGDKKICRLQDYKVNHTVEKAGTTKFKNLPAGVKLPTNKLSKYALQLSGQAEMLEDAGWTVQGYDIFVLEDGWKHYELERIPFKIIV